MAASGDIMLTTQQQTALDGTLGSRESQTVHVAAGGTAKRASVTFTCNSAYPCMITVEDNLGTIVAMWESQTLGEGTASVMASGLEPTAETDPLARLNNGGAGRIAAIINVAIDAEEVTTEGSEAPRGAYSGANNMIGGLGLGEAGVENIKGFTLKSSLNPNAADYDPEGSPSPTGGSTVMVSKMKDGERMYVDYHENAPNATVAQEGWNHKVLFRDWGDTSDDGDGGFETGVLMFSDMMAPMEADFDGDLADMFVNRSAWFAFTQRFDDMTGQPNDAVAISVGDEANQQTMSMMLTVGAPQLETLADSVTTGSEHKGTYFGAEGTFKCTQAAPGCGIRRDKGGDTPFGVQLASSGDTVTWEFKPDDEATVMVPDQDWMVYGAWLTTPDVEGGTHRLGVFFNGMNPYAAGNNVFTVGDANGLHGKAIYSGGAAGVYADGKESGMFTATADLTAYFDVDGNGTADPGDNDYMLSGKIHDFMDTAGNYLGTDTADDPNDPMGGGENDWVVQIPMTNIATGGTNGLYSAATATGSADGVPWTGQWSAQFYGAGDTAEDAVAPTGVAGSFRAATADGSTGVVGAFGATKDD